LSPLDLNHACSTIEAKSSKLKDRLSKKLDKKFNVLKQKKGIPQLSNLDDDDGGGDDDDDNDNDKQQDFSQINTITSC